MSGGGGGETDATIDVWVGPGILSRHSGPWDHIARRALVSELSVVAAATRDAACVRLRLMGGRFLDARLPRAVREDFGDNLTWICVNHASLCEVPAELARRRALLQRLDLRANRITQLPGWLARMERLQFLDVQTNALLRVPPALGDRRRQPRLELVLIGPAQDINLLPFYRDDFITRADVDRLHRSAATCYGYAPRQVAYALMAVWRHRQWRRRVPGPLMRRAVCERVLDSGGDRAWSTRYRPPPKK